MAKKKIEEEKVEAEETEEDIKIDVEVPKEEARKEEEDLKKVVTEDSAEARDIAPKEDVVTWKPKTSLGRLVLEGAIKNVDEILDQGKPIMEAQIIDMLMPSLESELLAIGQAKGKFGGGKRRVFKQTQKKTAEGNKPHFATVCVVGDRNGHIGIGYGKAKETVPAREKAIRNAKLNIFKIRRGAGSWEDASTESHSIPFKVKGKCGSVEITLMPAPQGTGLCVEKECAKMLALSGIKDIWSKTKGSTKTKLNLIKACEDALKKLMKVKIKSVHITQLSITEGPLSAAQDQAFIEQVKNG